MLHVCINMSDGAEKSSIHLIFFYMQSKELYKLTHQLCRLAKQEYHERKAELPDDVRDDVSFNKILEMIEYMEKMEHSKAMELLGEAYKEYQEMLSYIPRQPSRAGVCMHCLLHLSHLTRLWHFSSSVNSLFKRTCAAIQWG